MNSVQSSSIQMARSLTSRWRSGFGFHCPFRGDSDNSGKKYSAFFSEKLSQKIFPLIFLLFVPLFFLFSYNSGYGYDAVEYLVIARSLLDGFAPYEFIPSKSWGFYYWLHLMFALMGGNFTHVTVSILITAQAAAVILATYAVVKARFDAMTAALSGALVMISCVFMEMNFLEPEIPVVICGLLAYGFLTREGGRDSSIFIAGWWLGCGMLFKSVAAFYGVGIVAYWLFLVAHRQLSIPRFGSRVLWLMLGFSVLPVALACYFWSVGKFDAHVEWSYLFPLTQYPANTTWLGKFVTKLAWFHIFLLWVLGVTIWQREIRSQALTTPAVMALCWGFSAMLALLKTQASHYFFPAAVFFCLFMARVMVVKLRLGDFGDDRRIPAVLAIGGVLLLTNVVVVNPSAFGRLLTIRTYEEERRQARTLQELIPHGRRLLALTGAAASYYFFSQRYPNIPLVHTDVQATAYLGRHPDLLEKALADPHLAVVIYDDTPSNFADSMFLAGDESRIIKRAFEVELQRLYRPFPNGIFPNTVWVRREVPYASPSRAR
jgi:Dolichyl-phosphate-mannose-protein mannosyltransferase